VFPTLSINVIFAPDIGGKVFDSAKFTVCDNLTVDLAATLSEINPSITMCGSEEFRSMSTIFSHEMPERQMIARSNFMTAEFSERELFIIRI